MHVCKHTCARRPEDNIRGRQWLAYSLITFHLTLWDKVSH